MKRISFLVFLLLAIVPSARTQELLGKGKMYLRISNLRSDQSKILIRVNPVPNNDKWFGWNGKVIYVGLNGENADEKVAPEHWVAPGQRTPWVDIGQYMALRGTRSPITYLSSVLCGIMTSPRANGIDVLAEVATGPGTGVLRRIEVHRPEVKADGPRSYPWRIGCEVWNGGPLLPTVGLMIPTRPELTGRVYTLEEALRWQLDEIQLMPDIGRVPTEFVFVASGHPEVMKGLGYHNYSESTVEVNLGDEIGLSIKKPAAQQDQEFRATMKARGIDPLDLVAPRQVDEARALPPDRRWDLVHVEPALPERPKQFYESIVFKYGLWYAELAATTRAAEKAHPGKRVLAGANFSPHMNVWPDVRQWVDPFRANALTMSWTEDWWWQVPEITPQGYGFLLDGLRLGGSYHGAPMQFYVMPFAGQSPDNFRRMSAAGVAHGVKIFNHFIVHDQTLITWDYVDHTLSATMFPAIHNTIRDVGAVEHRLFPALPVPASVAILLSRASDTWDNEDQGGIGGYGSKYNVDTNERRAIWLALRHAHYPVDLITDQDVAEGRLKNYKVLYVVGREMLAAAVGPLKQWLHDGGTLYGTGGAGLEDEYRQPLKSLYEVFGIRGHELERCQRHISPRDDLPRTKPLDTLEMSPSDLTDKSLALKAILYRETFDLAPGATVLGKYKASGKVGAVSNAYGQGRAVLVGTLAGLNYLAPAATVSSDILPTAYPAVIRDFLVAPARVTHVERPVVASDPLVETQCMDGPNGRAIVLINWGRDAIADLSLRFPAGAQIKRVRSLRAAGYFKGGLDKQNRGELELKTINGQTEAHMPLAVTDYLLIN
jgi:hypothetical protein